MASDHIDPQPLSLDTVERVLARMSDGIYGIDTDWRFVLVNGSAERMLGVRAGELLGRVLWEAFPATVGTDFELHYREAAASGEPVVFDAYYPAPLDSWYRVRVFPDAAGITVHFSDIGTERRMEERIAHYDRLESLATLAGGVAHDFNNLLMVVAGHTSFLAEDLPDDHPAQHDVQAISEATERATALTRQLLSFTSQQVVNPTVVDLNVALLAERTDLERRLPEGVALRVLTRSEPVVTEIDEGELRRMLHHLVENAAEAMPEGGTVVIETFVTEIDAEAAKAYPGRPAGVYAGFTVSDDGDGMPPDVLARADEPFFTTRRGEGGTGLGLSAVHGIARQAGGHVSIYSETGVGTTVRVMLGCHETTERPLAVAPSDEEVGGTETLLVVDDNTSIGRLLERALTARGYRVVMANSGAEALEAARRTEGEIAMLITDVVMPGMTGAELAVALRAEVGPLPVLFVSGYTENTVIARGIPGEDVEFLSKPFAARDLVRQVRVMLDRA